MINLESANQIMWSDELNKGNSYWQAFSPLPRHHTHARTHHLAQIEPFNTRRDARETEAEFP